MPLSIDEIITILDQYAELDTATFISIETDERFLAIKISFVTTDGLEHTGFYSGRVCDHAPDGSVSGGRLAINGFPPYSAHSCLIARNFDFSHIESITPVNPERLAKARAIIAQNELVRASVLTIAKKVTLAKEKMKQGDVKGAESLQYQVLRDIRARPYSI